MMLRTIARSRLTAAPHQALKIRQYSSCGPWGFFRYHSRNPEKWKEFIESEAFKKFASGSGYAPNVVVYRKGMSRFGSLLLWGGTIWFFSLRVRELEDKLQQQEGKSLKGLEPAIQEMVRQELKRRIEVIEIDGST